MHTCTRVQVLIRETPATSAAKGAQTRIGVISSPACSHACLARRCGDSTTTRPSVAQGTRRAAWVRCAAGGHIQAGFDLTAE